MKEISSRELTIDALQFTNLGAATLRSGLQSNELVALQKNAAGFCSFGSLLKNRDALGLNRSRSGYSLGIATHGDFNSAPLEAALDVLGLIHFYEAHEYFGINMNRSNHIDTFMNCLTKSGKPTVFFVPPNVYRYRGTTGGHYFVADEMQWYLEKPAKRAGSSIFCFGLYDVVKPECGYVNKDALSQLFSQVSSGRERSI